MGDQVFLVDDDTDDQEIFIMALQEINPEISCSVASNGVEALEKLSEEPFYIPRYIFVDINMHKMNGIECLEHIKKIDRLKNSQIIMLSTSADESIVKQCKQLGADHFLAKPPGLTLLVEALRKLIK